MTANPACPHAGEGRGMCMAQKVYARALTGGTLGAVAVAAIAGAPAAWSSRSRRRPTRTLSEPTLAAASWQQPAPDDPLLGAASWSSPEAWQAAAAASRASRHKTGAPRSARRTVRR